MRILATIGFSILFLIGALLLGGFIGLLPQVGESVALVILLAGGLTLLLRWRRKIKKEGGQCKE